jgi:hypothetical protein
MLGKLRPFFVNKKKQKTFVNNGFCCGGAIFVEFNPISKVKIGKTYLIQGS